MIAVGTRLGDFTTASKTAFQNAGVRFININIADFDAHKHAALPLVADARVTLDELREGLNGYQVNDEYVSRIANFKEQWGAEVSEIESVKRAREDYEKAVKRERNFL